MSDISQSNELNVHDTLIKLTQSIKSKSVAVSLSSGIDSMSVLYALLECNKTVVVYSFTLDDRESRDFREAKELANKLNLKFVPVFLPTDIETLKKDVLKLHEKYDCIKKTDYICSWPYLYLSPMVSESVLATGMAADGHFCISKKGVLHYKDDIVTFRKNYFSNPNRCQLPQRTKMAEENDVELFEPYLDTLMYEYLLNSSWDECNKPQQKMPIRRAFDYEHVHLHTNFQLGDSGINEHFEKLLLTDWNNKNYKSVVGIFNRINRGEIPNAKPKLRKLI